MSGPAKIGETVFTEFDICYISSFYKDGIKYSSVLDFIDRNNSTDIESSLTLRGSLYKFEDNIHLVNKLLETKNTVIEYPYNCSKINYALILRAIRAYFEGDNQVYNECLTELNC